MTAQDQGILNYQKEDYIAAEKYYDSILSTNKNNSEALFGKGASLYMQDDVKNAEIKFNESLSSREKDLRSKAFYNLGNINYKNNNLSEALHFYKKALELNPDDDEARYNYEYIKYQKKPEEEKKDEEKKDDEKKDEEKDENSQSQQKPLDEKKSQDLKKAESILDALKNDEKVMQKQQLQRFKTKKLLKDW